MQARIDVFFSLHLEGWSENINVVCGSYAAGATIAQNYATMRSAMQCSDVSVDGARIHNTDVKNDYYPLAIHELGTYSGGTGDQSMEPFSAALPMKMWSSVNFKRATRFFRGIPASQMVLGYFAPVAGFSAAMNALIAFFKSSGVCIATPNPPGPSKFVFTQITDVVQEGIIRSKDTGRPFFQPRGRRAIA